MTASLLHFYMTTPGFSCLSALRGCSCQNPLISACGHSAKQQATCQLNPLIRSLPLEATETQVLICCNSGPLWLHVKLLITVWSDYGINNRPSLCLYSMLQPKDCLNSVSFSPTFFLNFFLIFFTFVQDCWLHNYQNFLSYLSFYAAH